MPTTLQRDDEPRRALWPKLAREGQMVGSIDPRREKLRGIQWSAQRRNPVWTSRRGTHLGSGHIRPRQQTGHMIAIASIHTLTISCEPGAVHIWIPACAEMSGVDV